MEKKTRRKTKPNKKQIMKNMNAVILNYMEEKLKNTTLLLNILNSPGFQKLIKESFNDIKELKKEMKDELDVLIRRCIKINSNNIKQADK